MLMARLKKRLAGELIEISVDMACAMLRDDQCVVGLARAVALRGKQRARKHLDHYLHGQGLDLAVETKSLLSDDDCVRRYLLGEIDVAMNRGEKAGVVRIGQEVFGDQDWRYALGGVELHWRLNEQDVEVWVVGRYEWHGAEGRVTKKLHEAATRLERQGARAYAFVGKKTCVMRGEIEEVKNAVGQSSMGFVSVNLL